MRYSYTPINPEPGHITLGLGDLAYYQPRNTTELWKCQIIGHGDCGSEYSQTEGVRIQISSKNYSGDRDRVVPGKCVLPREGWIKSDYGDHFSFNRRYSIDIVSGHD